MTEILRLEGRPVWVVSVLTADDGDLIHAGKSWWQVAEPSGRKIAVGAALHETEAGARKSACRLH